ncbi:MAG: crossover junction endodeoxyribonuclease RuvC [Sphingobacteriales bacterium]|jgi:crossover junction endodeoxyribonuclease RuvC|nr:crossover junction endodeoxyribonuclease RuvC [Sphingobacteriales bacterium]MBP9140066.1 crossover junction endodeoxyribonuclease RuvC [Chitinophagales bacterium]MDA0197852.1 crossover junction endodeoxyribonuclease RuvC [Bacteroidota bacterium]MBK6889927.1 crossover junction endodeoxyribonuclease RuvC [Sphingobacteriales bacterium]MBK7527549.1 crossover junction endodeoxyribonuclease RuvC [Sphingobacteriales bacterium]
MPTTAKTTTQTQPVITPPPPGFIRIAGVDPGTTAMGYAIIDAAKNEHILLSMGVIQLHKYPDAYVKLEKIFERLHGIFEYFNPNVLAIEAPFYGSNVQSMLKLGRAQGVAITAAMLHKMPVFEYAPRKIKQAITGNGNASKEQVAALLLKMLQLNKAPSFLDATDALGVAVCHSFQVFSALGAGNTGNSLGANKPARKKKPANWDSFIAENPHRVKK